MDKIGGKKYLVKRENMFLLGNIFSGVKAKIQHVLLGVL